MNGEKHGYGIYWWADGRVYFGELKRDKRDGQGCMRWLNGDEYYGEFKNDMQWGEGVSQENGQLNRVRYEKDKLISKRKISKIVEQK
jgi:hypothetical protein